MYPPPKNASQGTSGIEEERHTAKLPTNAPRGKEGICPGVMTSSMLLLFGLLLS